MSYDVIIVGASFAGLAVAAPLRGKRVLLLDRKPVGTRPTSACGSLVHTLQALGLEAAIQQVHDHLVLHTPKRTWIYPVSRPFCTFDYATLCRLLQQQNDAEFVQERALRLDGRVADDGCVADDGRRVYTPQGIYEGELIVDASGWRTVLGGQRRSARDRRAGLSFGIEMVAPYREEGLHFWYDPRRLALVGMAWAFPCNGEGRIGIGSYRGETRLQPGLDAHLNNLGLPLDGPVHGGYFPHALGAPLAGNTFLVGDSAGQCMALTGEGIRPALYFGTHLGRLLRRVLDGELSLAAARDRYCQLVEERRWGYRLLTRTQRLISWLPAPLALPLAGYASQPERQRKLLDRYVAAFEL